MFIKNEQNNFKNKYFIFDGDYEYLNYNLGDLDVNVYLENAPFKGAKFMYCDDMTFDELLDVYNTNMRYKLTWVPYADMSLFEGDNVNDIYYRVLICNFRFFRVYQ